MNVAFTFNVLSHLKEHEFFEILGPPETEELARQDGESLGSFV